MLAERWSGATADQREVYATMFDAANRHLGNLCVGELGLAGRIAREPEPPP